MKKCFILFVILLFVFKIMPVNAQINTNHWAYSYFSKAMNEQWIDNTQENFEPEKATTRAEFVRMLEKAIKLTPDSNASKFLEQASSNKNTVPFTDTSTHWILTGGWLKAALNFGLIMPLDYDNNKFNPDTPITRRECIIMIARALGKVYPTTLYANGNALFNDWNLIPEWAKGYVNELVNYKLLVGYPDGTVQAGDNLTQAEAAALISRAVDEMTQGVDSNIKIFEENLYPKDYVYYKKQQIELPVPAQIINNKIYVPVRAIYNNGGKLYSSAYGGAISYNWNTQTQILGFEYGVIHQFQAGNAYTGFYSNLLPFIGNFKDPGNQLVSEVRILFGELMVPVINNGESVILRSTSIKVWDANTKTLTIPVNVPQAPTS